MQLKKIIREYQGLIFSIAIFFACSMGLLFGVVPLLQRSIDLNNKLSPLSGEVNALNNKMLVLQTVDEDGMRSYLQTLLSAVPSDKSISTLFMTVDNLAGQTGVSVDSLSLARPGSLATESAKRLTVDEQAIGANILPFTLSVNGTFDQIRAFFTAATSVRRLFRIQAFSISFRKNNIINANITMNAFYFPIPTTIGSISQPITALSDADSSLVAKISALQLLVQPSAAQAVPNVIGKPDPFSL